MEKLTTLLIADRGEIAVRICRTAKKLNIKTVAIYSEADAASQHVQDADEAVLLPGSNATAYTDEATILRIAKEKGAEAIIPGYGFLSENAHFARLIRDAGIVWVGPSPASIEAFGIKHTAKQLAEEANVPTVPGSRGLVADEEAAVKEAERIGFPVMLKATGGGGGMGLVTCNKVEEVRHGFSLVQSRGKTLFKNSGVFIEAFYPASHHIEVQVFGNGQGQAVHFGERECSIQRRHQKLIEECPSPFVEKRPEMRKKLGDAAVRLAESINYGSAGTIEHLVDDKSGEFFFLEMNTRLQVEHGITELCYNIDLVELMLQQADAELAGRGGLDGAKLKQMQPSNPLGSAIEARVYAENPLKDYAPSPGLLQKVAWKDVPGSRIDTWVFTGSRVTSNYDPLIAKVMVHSDSRETTVAKLREVLTESSLCGPSTNLEFLSSISGDPRFQAGDTMTSFLQNFKYNPSAIDVISAGAYTLIQDLPGRPAIGKGIPHSGPMDPLAFQIANVLVGNARGKEGLEITLSGPKLGFFSPAIVALCGAAMEATLDDKEFPMWTGVKVQAGQKLEIGKTTGPGCRSYLAVYGGFPSVADYFGSKSTSPLVAIGGNQGRALAPGDLLQITSTLPEDRVSMSLPDNLWPDYKSKWEISAMVGPHDEGYFDPDFIKTIYDTEWKVSHNASRSGIRLAGPVPKWARKDGGEGGAHPSNLIEYGYPLGTLNWTGDDACIFPVDCPNFGGFASSTTVIRADWWKLGQIKAGDFLKYVRVGLEDALKKRRRNEVFLESIEEAVRSKSGFDRVEKLNRVSFHVGTIGDAVIWEKAGTENTPRVRYRQGGDDHLLIEYGHETFELNHRCRVTALENALQSSSTPDVIKSNLYNTVGCCTTLLLYYNGAKLPRPDLVAHLQSVESQLGDLRATKVPTRIFKLPISFESKLQDEATQRYMTNQRPHAPYLPDNLAFVAKNNAFTPQQLKDIYLSGQFMAVVVGFFCGNTVSLPVDPRQRLSAPKMNPSRVFTPEGTVGWAGSCMSIYPVDSPGGYQMTGRTVPCWDYYSYKPGFSKESQPWIFRDFDILTFYQVSEQELDGLLGKFRAGKYNWEYKYVEFDMAEHNNLLASTRDEVAEIRKKQAVAQDEMTKAENESLERWRKEKAETQLDEGIVERLLDDSSIVSVEAPVDANVWKVEVKEGDEAGQETVIVILEAMKLEIAVKTPESVTQATKAKVEKMLVKPGDTVTAGAHLALLRRES